MIIDNLLPLLLFSFISAVTPGPNNIMIMTSGLNYGIRASLPHCLGICIGFPILVLAIGFGVSIIFNQYPVMYTLIKIAGIGYLFFLSWKIATATNTSNNNQPSKPLTFMQAALFQWLNPKAWVMATSAFATFSQTGSVAETIIIAMVFFSFTFPSVSIWLFFGSWLQRWLKEPRTFKIFNTCMAALLIFSILPVVAELIAEYTNIYYQPF